jgi:formylglycine-generating enzyme required for sulfatase activity
LDLYLAKIKCGLSRETISAYLSSHRVLFLIDGLDEVPKHLRPDLVEIIAQYQFENKESRFLLTGRPHGVKGKAGKRFGKALCEIHPLDNAKIEDFITRWFRAVSGRAKGLGNVTAEGLIGDIRRHEHISSLTQSPLLLTAVCILYQDGKRIPDQRADLYNRIIDNLINRRFHDPAQPEKENKILEFLMRLAFESQAKNRKTIDIDDAFEILKKTLPRKEGEDEFQYNRHIRELFDEIEPGCGFFNHGGGDEIQFSHLTFQEFLAAKYMVYMEIDFIPFLEKEWWQETLLLYAGFMNLDRKKRSNDIVKSILTAKTKRKGLKGHLPLLGARALCDFQVSKRDEKIVSLAREKLYGLIDSDDKLESRFQAGVLLGLLGDTRIPGESMVLIPEGEFTRGSDDENEDEKPQRRIFLDAFKIGKYPVTNREFERFVEANGYREEELWTTEGWKWRCEEDITEPEYWHDRQWNGVNFPVVGVSWYEAAAYAAWLSRETGMPFRLPTEAEWEKAARGPDGNIYPWGNTFNKKYCNSYESDLSRTSPVSIFPGGKSVYGCFDIAGNVWEWCSDWYGSDYYSKSPLKNPTGPDSGAGRVVRGGGWGSSAGYLRCADRGVGWPSSRYDNIGFRLCQDK